MANCSICKSSRRHTQRRSRNCLSESRCLLERSLAGIYRNANITGSNNIVRVEFKSNNLRSSGYGQDLSIRDCLAGTYDIQ